MEDPKGELTRKTNDWLPKEGHDKWRDEYTSKEAPIILKEIDDAGYLFGDLDSGEKRMASDLMARFSFGVTSVLRRFGYKNNVSDIPVRILEHEDIHQVGAGMAVSKDGTETVGIFMSPDWLKEMVRIAEKGEFAEKL